MLAVDRYLKDFNRVQYCYNDNKDIEFTSRATGLNKFVVKDYFEILDELKKLNKVIDLPYGINSGRSL